MENKYTEAVQAAWLDYAQWSSKVRRGQTAGSPNELRGIFYNKLIGRLKEKVGMSIWDIRKNLFPSDFSCRFESPGYISELGLAVDIEYKYYDLRRREILSNLHTALKQVELKTYSGKMEWELDKIINSIKI